MPAVDNKNLTMCVLWNATRRSDIKIETLKFYFIFHTHEVGKKAEYIGIFSEIILRSKKWTHRHRMTSQTYTALWDVRTQKAKSTNPQQQPMRPRQGR